MQCFFLTTYLSVKSIVLVTNWIFSPRLLNYVFPDSNAPPIEENHILGSPLLQYFIFLWCPDENKPKAYYKTQSSSAFDGLI